MVRNNYGWAGVTRGFTFGCSVKQGLFKLHDTFHTRYIVKGLAQGERAPIMG